MHSNTRTISCGVPIFGNWCSKVHPFPEHLADLSDTCKEEGMSAYSPDGESMVCRKAGIQRLKRQWPSGKQGSDLDGLLLTSHVWITIKRFCHVDECARFHVCKPSRVDCRLALLLLALRYRWYVASEKKKKKKLSGSTVRNLAAGHLPPVNLNLTETFLGCSCSAFMLSKVCLLYKETKTKSILPVALHNLWPKADAPSVHLGAGPEPSAASWKQLRVFKNDWLSTVRSDSNLNWSSQFSWNVS